MTDPAASVSRNLGEIIDLSESLLTQAVARARSSDDDGLIGGEAMVDLGPTWNVEQGQHRLAAREDAYYRDWFDDLPATWPQPEPEGESTALGLLLFWSENLRRETDHELGNRRPTLVSEAHFLRSNLDVLRYTLHTAQWDDFTGSVQSALAHLEVVLMAGKRPVLGAPCMYDECKGRRIRREMQERRDKDGNKVWVQTDWFCPSCHRTWSPDAYAAMVVAAAHSQRFVEIDGHTWCDVPVAAKETGIPASTIRSWVRRRSVGVACIISGKRRGFVSLTEVRSERGKENRTGPRNRHDSRRS